MNRGPSQMVQISLLDLPVEVWSRAQQHSDGLLREFSLFADGLRHDPQAMAPLPVRLIQLVEELSANYSGFSTDQETRLAAAAEAGERSIDLSYTIPRSVSGAAVRLAEALDEADEYCRQGRHLLTLATPQDLVQFREWFLQQFVDQAAGAPPLSWPDYLARQHQVASDQTPTTHGTNTPRQHGM
jgi:hypothetical protein